MHMASGYAALMAAYYIGPAASHPEDEEEEPDEKAPANIPIVVLGTGLLWFGWFGVSGF